LELSRELIGAVALGFFWVHTLLIAAAAWLDGRGLAKLTNGRIRAATVRSGLGPDDALACNVVEQIGRSKGDGVIHFSDAAHRSELFGGVVELDEGGTLELEPGTEVAVWPIPQRRVEAAAPESAELVASAAIEARRARGWPRVVSVAITAGERVFMVEREGIPSIISAIDPRRWLARKRWLIAGFVLAELALASACTIAIFWPPLFDWISMLGAAAALGLFLAVQPIGVAVRDAVRTPDRAYLRGRWDASA
jgi:hypothetical protein